MSDVPIHAAASVVLLRQSNGGAQVLMGQRGAGAVFMPSKFVFPGGRVDQGDAANTSMMSGACLHRLRQNMPDDAPEAPALIGCARRELAEETGLHLTRNAALQFVFRAITPPGSPRRFDARFFLANAADVTGPLDDFSDAEDELSHLHWVSLADVRRLDLPFITEIVLAELRGILAGHDQPGVPFFDNSGSTPMFRRLT